MDGIGKTIALSFGLIGALGACVTGGESAYDRVPGEDDDRLDALKIVCETQLNVSGTFVEGTAQPDTHTGCWDVGTWTVNTFETAVEGCSPAPTLEAEYIFEARRDDEDAADTTIKYMNDPEFERVNLKITTAGDGLCHGAFSIFLEDFTEVTLNPTLQADGTLSGIGAFRVHTEDPY